MDHRNTQVAYVLSQLEQGVTHAELTATMLTHGYDEVLINELFAEANERLFPSVPPPHVSVPENQAPMQESVVSTVHQLPSALTLIKEAVFFTYTRLDIFGWASLFLVGGWVFLMLMGAVTSFLLDSPDAAGGAVISVIVIIAFVSTFTLYALSLLYSGAIMYAASVSDDTDFWTGFRWVWQNLWVSFWTYCLMSFVMLGSFVFFIIPGIIVGVFTAFTLVVLFNENIRGLDALVRSTQLVRGQWWPVAGRLAALLGVMLLFGMLLIFIPESSGLFLLFQAVFGVLFTIFFMHGMGSLYRGLVQLQGGVQVVEKPDKAVSIYRFIGVFGLLGVFAIPIILAALSGAETKGQDAAVKARLNNLRATAELYYDVGESSYAGFCDSAAWLGAINEINAQSMNDLYPTCASDASNYMFAAPLSDGRYFCADATSFGAGEVSVEPLGVSCPGSVKNASVDAASNIASGVVSEEVQPTGYTIDDAIAEGLIVPRTESETQVAMIQTFAQGAERYYAENGSYSGMCNELSSVLFDGTDPKFETLFNSFKCYDAAESYAVSVFSEGQYFCSDRYWEGTYEQAPTGPSCE